MSSLQKNASKSVGELASRLVTLMDASTGETLTSELRDWVYMLKVHRLRHCSDAHEFCNNGGVEALTKLVSRCCTNRENRDLVLLLGTLGNVTALDKSSRDAVMTTALDDIANILQTSNSSDVLNTTSRVLANLALDEQNIQIILEHEVMPHLSQILARDRRLVNSGCKRSLLRAIRVFSKSSEFREDLKASDGMISIVDCLKSDEEELALAAVGTLEAVTQYSDLDLIQPLCTKLSMQSVVRYCNHTKKSIRKGAMNVLLNCAKSSDGRIALSSAGGVETLVAYMESSSKDSTVFNEVVCAVCICCRDVPSRQRLRDCGGLERLIQLLLKEEHAFLHNNIMSALVCYYFDENTLKFMVKRLGLLKALTYHMQEMTPKLLTVVTSSSMDEGTCSSFEESDEKMQASQSTLSEVDSSDMMECNDEKCEELLPLSSGQDNVSDANSQWTQDDCDGHTSLVRGSLKRPLTEDCVFSLQDEQENTSMFGHLESSSTDTLSDITVEETTTPPPTKKCKLQIDFDLSSPMPANFLDSLLSSPNPYQNQVKPVESPFSYEFNSPLEKQAILMLSRVSHLRDCLTNLATPDILLAMLGFFVSSQPTNVPIFKVLTRIFMNPHCFQDCLASLVPSRIYEYLRQQPDDQELFPPMQTTPLSPILSPSGSGGFQVPVFRNMCNELLDRLSKIAESPYGQGVLAHSLLRGEEKEKQASSLTLPLLCRSPRLCQRMMLGYGGFKILTDLARSSEVTPLQTMAVDSLLALAHTLQKRSTRKQRYSNTLKGDTDAMVPYFQLHKLDSSLDNMSLCEDSSLTQHVSHSSSVDDKHYCRHLDSDHCPFDLNITACSEADNRLTVPVHKSTLVETSDVFSVMLAGQYVESESSEVEIHDISPLSFLSLIHHIYGCGWNCETVMKKVVESEISFQMDEPHFGMQCLSSFTSNTLVSQIVAHCGAEDEMKKAQHCLQVLACAGRFLLGDLATLCEHAAVSYLQPANVVLMFQFARLHQCYCLSESCVRTIVSFPHSPLRTDVFKDLILSPEGDAALEIIALFLSAAD